MTSVPAPAPKKKMNWFWPNITDLETAREAAKGTMYAGFLVAGITLAFIIIAKVQQGADVQIGLSALIDVALFTAIAIGGKFHVRAAGVAGPALFILEKVYAFTNGSAPGGGGMVFAVVLLMIFITGMRGIFAVHKFRGAKG